MSGGPALIDLVLYVAGGFVVFPILGTALILRFGTDIRSTQLLVIFPVAAVSSPAGYYIGSVTHLSVLSVWNLAVGPVFALCLCSVLSYYVVSRLNTSS